MNNADRGTGFEAHQPALRRTITSFALCSILCVAISGCGPAVESSSVHEATAAPEVATAPPDPETTPAVPVRPVPGPEMRGKLVSWWLRHDQSYMMILDAIGEDGRVEARYLNPAPIHVSRAETWIEQGRIRLLLELTDRNYPGNYYELVYQPETEMWVGLYHHLGNGQTYEVYFTRFEDPSE